MVNRAILMLRYKEPALRWIIEADPAGRDEDLTLDQVNQERTVYLVSDPDADTSDDVRAWVRRNWKVLFENELEGWYTDPALWPRDRSFATFEAWFDVECHTVLYDTVGSPIFDDEDVTGDFPSAGTRPPPRRR